MSDYFSGPKNSILECWQEYDKLLQKLPINETEKLLAKRSFYAGVASLLHMISRMDQMSEKEGVAKLNSFLDEIQAFSEEILAEALQRLSNAIQSRGAPEGSESKPPVH